LRFVVLVAGTGAVTRTVLEIALGRGTVEIVADAAITFVAVVAVAGFILSDRSRR
jgi:hypothetical protein